jgi:hypothetical protein
MYALPMTGLDVARVFNTMETKKQQYGVKEWGVS